MSEMSCDVRNDVVDVRSSSVDAPRLTTQFEPSGSAPNTFGYRAVLVRSVPRGEVTLRYSGSIWKNRMRDGNTPIDAGFTGESGSASAIAPPVPCARELNLPAEYPKPWTLKWD